MSETATRLSADPAPRRSLRRALAHSIGTVARAWALHDLGLTPEIVAIARLLAGAPGLAEVLGKPAVRDLLRDPASARELAALLDLAATQNATASIPVN